MPILTKKDILMGMHFKLIGLEGEPKINATSIDVKIGQLLDYKTMKAVPLNDGGWLLEPKSFFLYELADKCHLAPGFHGKIHSRSSWARYGVESRDVDDDFSVNIWNDYRGKVICSIRTLGTSVKIRPGDALAQMHLAYDGFIPLSDNEMKEVIGGRYLIIKREDKTIDQLVRAKIVDGREIIAEVDENDHFNTGGFTLTSDSVIQVYTGEIIDPGQPGNYFERKKITEEGLCLENKFFLSSSAEEVLISPHFVGWVQEFNNLLIDSGYKKLTISPDKQPSSLQTHAAAPKIDPFPVFSGKITFENYAPHEFIFKPGQRITELFLYLLNSPCPIEETSCSRYKGQTEALQSKAHEDSNQ